MSPCFLAGAVFRSRYLSLLLEPLLIKEREKRGEGGVRVQGYMVQNVSVLHHLIEDSLTGTTPKYP